METTIKPLPLDLPTPPINANTHVGPSFSLRNRVARGLWGLAELLLFRFSPRPLHAWRAFVLRCFGAQVGRGVHVYPGAEIWAPWNLVLADECAVASGAILYCQGTITVGRRAVISQGAHLVTGTHDYTQLGFPLLTRPITIGDQAWVAADVFIHPGVCIGEGAVIGARSVVTRSMPAWMVCAGHPCVARKPRQLAC